MQYGMTLFHLSALGRIDLLKMLILEYNGQVNVVNSVRAITMLKQNGRRQKTCS